MVSTVASQEEGPEFDSTVCPGPFYVEFTCSACVCVGYLRVLRLPLTVQRYALSAVRLIGDSKLGVYLSVLALCQISDLYPLEENEWIENLENRKQTSTNNNESRVFFSYQSFITALHAFLFFRRHISSLPYFHLPCCLLHPHCSQGRWTHELSS